MKNYVQAQGKYYYAFDKKIYLNEVKNKAVLSLNN